MSRQVVGDPDAAVVTAQTGCEVDVVVAGGVESMSRTPMGASLANGGHPYPEAFRSRYSQTPNQGTGAEMIAEQWGFDRTALDQFSLSSHEKAAAAQDAGAFDDQIVGIKDHGLDVTSVCARHVEFFSTGR